MLDNDLAQQLARAGLEWTPAERDTFMIAGTALEQKVFVISELTAQVQRLAGQQHITFHGSSEWALDHVMLRDATWLPSETQLRLQVEARAPESQYLLERQPQGYRCLFPSSQVETRFYPSAEDAYAAALLQLLSSQPGG